MYIFTYYSSTEFAYDFSTKQQDLTVAHAMMKADTINTDFHKTELTLSAVQLLTKNFFRDRYCLTWLVYLFLT